MKYDYEWDVETTVDGETDDYVDGEVLDHHHVGTYAEAVEAATEWKGEPGRRFPVVLVCTRVLRNGELDGRWWAYVIDGVVPSRFRDCYDNEGPEVPVRFIREVAASSLHCPDAP